MGAWGVNAFDNDAACDWKYGLDDVDDLSLIELAFDAVLESDDDYLDADVASEALAACEVIARLRGNWGVRNAYTESMDQWVEANPRSVPAELSELATVVIDRILAHPSELLDLWAESADSGGEWKTSVTDLRARVVA